MAHLVRTLLASLLLAVVVASMPQATAADPDVSFTAYPGADTSFFFVLDHPTDVTLVVSVDAGVATEFSVVVEHACIGHAPVLPSPSTQTFRFNCGPLYLHTYDGTISTSLGVVDGVLHIQLGTL